MSDPVKPSFHRLDVQGLRAVAIIGVLLVHFYASFFPNGYLGVDIFFAISGYLIYTIFLRNVRKDGLNWGTISNFYYRRLARIVPLNLVYVCCAVVVYCYLATPIVISQSQKAATRALFFVSNIFYAFEPTHSVLWMNDENLFAHTWSLGVEVQYYLVVPILFLIDINICGKNFIFYPVVFVASLIFFISCPKNFEFMMPARLFEFVAITFFTNKIVPQSKCDVVDEEEKAKDGLSVRLSSIYDRFMRTNSVFDYIIYYCAFLLVLMIQFFPFVRLPVRASRITVSFCSTLLIAFGSNVKNPVLSNPLSVFIGDISYSLYLFHWPIFVYICGPFRAIDWHWGIPLSITTTVTIYNAFEKHYRTWSKKVLLTFSLFTFIFAVVLILISPQISRALQEKVSVTKDAAIKENEKMFTHWTDALYQDNCNYTARRNRTIGKPMGLCAMPKGDGKLKFLVVGDSYAANMGGLIYAAFKPHFADFNMFSMSGCEAFSHSTNRSMCIYHAEFKDVISDFAPDVVFVIQKFSMPNTDNTFEDLEMGLDDLYSTSSRFFVMDTIPDLDKETMQRLSMLIKEGRSAEAINKALIRDEGRAGARARITKLMEHCGTKCYLFDVKPAISDTSGKVMAIDEESYLSIYEPHGHFTQYGVAKIAQVFNLLARQYSFELIKLVKQLYPAADTTLNCAIC